jgi:hypothetical protein
MSQCDCIIVEVFNDQDFDLRRKIWIWFLWRLRSRSERDGCHVASEVRVGSIDNVR